MGEISKEYVQIVIVVGVIVAALLGVLVAQGSLKAKLMVEGIFGVLLFCLFSACAFIVCGIELFEKFGNWSYIVGEIGALYMTISVLQKRQRSKS